MIDPDAPSAPVARLLARAAAWLVLLGLLTGIYVSAAMTGKVAVDAHAALASHLNAILGAFLLLGVAVTLPLLRYGPTGQRRLAWAFIVANFANWWITAVKSALHVSGVDWTGQPANNAIFVALTLGVVLPGLGGAVAWVHGLSGKARS